MGALKVQRYSNTEMERQPGEVARLRVLKGADRGQVFIIRDSSVILGRGDEANIRVADLKTSRVHARLDFTHEGWMVTDLGSANGIFFQGEYVRQSKLASGEHFTLGETIFEFLTSDQETRLLTAPLRSGEEVARQDMALVHQRERVQAYAQPVKTASATAATGKKKENKARTLLLFALVAGAYYYTMMDQPAQQQGQKKKKTKGEEEKKAAESEGESAAAELEIARTAEQYFQQGFREFRERNFMRAKAQFELSLQVNPNHWQARHYLLLSENGIKTEIQKMMLAAQKSKSAGRLRETKGYLEAAMRLMYNDQSNPDFIECEEELKKINKEIERTPIR
jgi:pSer/pThr/pTyr-binding forkhead associated (FHA) protein